MVSFYFKSFSLPSKPFQMWRDTDSTPSFWLPRPIFSSLNQEKQESSAWTIRHLISSSETRGKHCTTFETRSPLSLSLSLSKSFNFVRYPALCFGIWVGFSLSKLFHFLYMLLGLWNFVLKFDSWLMKPDKWMEILSGFCSFGLILWETTNFAFKKESNKDKGICVCYREQ